MALVSPIQPAGTPGPVAHPGAPFPAPQMGGIAWRPPAAFHMPSIVGALGGTGVPLTHAGGSVGMDSGHVARLVGQSYGQALVNQLQGSNWTQRIQGLEHGIQSPGIPPLSNPGGVPGGPPVDQNPFGYPYPPGWFNPLVDYMRGA